jgi:hypothetical protein
VFQDLTATMRLPENALMSAETRRSIGERIQTLYYPINAPICN